MDENKEKQGTVQISSDVIAQYAGMEAMGCFGIVGLGAVSMRDGIVKVLKNDRVHKGVTVRLSGSDVTIDFHIIVAYGVSIQAVAENLISNVTYQVENFTGLHVEKINVFVDGVRVID